MTASATKRRENLRTAKELRLSDVCELYGQAQGGRLEPNTIHNSQREVRRLSEFLKNPRLATLRIEDVERWLSSLKRPHVSTRGRVHPPVSAGGYNSSVRRIRVVLRWLFSRGYLGADIASNLRTAREPERAYLRLTKAQMRGMLEDAPSARCRAIVAVAYFTALRGSEISGIRLSDVDFDSGTISVRVAKKWTQDRIVITTELRRELLRWLAEYGSLVLAGRDRELLPADFLIPRPMMSVSVPLRPGFRTFVPGSVDPGLPDVRLQTSVKAALDSIGLPSHREGVHTLRRTSARHMFDALVETGHYEQCLRIVQALLHHCETRTTERYIGLSTEVQTRDEFMRTVILLGDEPELAPPVIELPGTRP